MLSLAARKIKQVKGAPDGMEVRPMMDVVPQTPEEMARLKETVASMPIYINALVSPDGKAAAVVADFKQDATHAELHHAQQGSPRHPRARAR